MDSLFKYFERIPTGERLTSWLFTLHGQGYELGTILRTNPDGGRMEDLDQSGNITPKSIVCVCNFPLLGTDLFYMICFYF